QGRPRIVLEFIIRLDHEDRQDIRQVVVFQNFYIHGVVRVGGVQLDERNPLRVVGGATDPEVQLYGVEVAVVEVLDPEGHGGRVLVVGGSPSLVVVAVQPDDVVEVCIPLSEILSVGATLVGSVALQHGEPASGFGRIQKHEEAVLRRELKNLIGPSKVRLVRRGQVVRNGERHDSIECASD